MDNETKLKVEESIVEMLKTVYDPEIPVNVYDLGLKGCGRTPRAPSRFAHSAGDEGEDLLGKCDHNAASDGEHAVGALGGVVALEGQAQLEDAETQQDEADGPDEGKDRVAHIRHNRSFS